MQLRLIKIIVKAMNKKAKDLLIQGKNFPKLCEVKMKEEIFIGRKFKKLFEDHFFNSKLNSTGRRTWKTFENICRNREIGVEQI